MKMGGQTIFLAAKSPNGSATPLYASKEGEQGDWVVDPRYARRFDSLMAIRKFIQANPDKFRTLDGNEFSARAVPLESLKRKSA